MKLSRHNYRGDCGCLSCRCIKLRLTRTADIRRGLHFHQSKQVLRFFGDCLQILLKITSCRTLAPPINDLLAFPEPFYTMHTPCCHALPVPPLRHVMCDAPSAYV